MVMKSAYCSCRARSACLVWDIGCSDCAPSPSWVVISASRAVLIRRAGRISLLRSGTPAAHRCRSKSRNLPPLVCFGNARWERLACGAMDSADSAASFQHHLRDKNLTVSAQSGDRLASRAQFMQHYDFVMRPEVFEKIDHRAILILRSKTRGAQA